MKKVVLILAVVAMIMMVGCAAVTPLAATSNPVGTKVGESSASYLLGFFPMSSTSDAGIQKAAQNGGITRISTVDVKEKNMFFLRTVTTIVTGE